jgi:hypothetical protein
MRSRPIDKQSKKMTIHLKNGEPIKIDVTFARNRMRESTLLGRVYRKLMDKVGGVEELLTKKEKNTRW